MVTVTITVKHLANKDLHQQITGLFHNVFHRCGKLEGGLQGAWNQDISVGGK
jgi:hypothetical protein